MVQACLVPPCTARKRKASTLHDNDWEPYRARITSLHKDMSLKDIVATIEAQSPLQAEQVLRRQRPLNDRLTNLRMRQCKYRFSKWGLRKNINSKEMGFIVMQRQRRKLVDVEKPPLRFRVRGKDVENAKIDRWMKSHGIRENDLYVTDPAIRESSNHLESLVSLG